ncbi:hypothetical protein APT_00132 [Acetobacter pasteurianus NBRC 101655]|nr:hypothetical protein APT_00132 [Acetobacter pasteurianus NBRC 101655]GAB30323.1 hypothetical protein APS_0925 [Acetobacter pasteurianus subsp. pasteurianus LMG 1262 = NBRC 106471]CCT59701.1 hypothetical protein APA386B_1626 [Acetobacter pasteurianus 386B]
MFYLNNANHSEYNSKPHKQDHFSPVSCINLRLVKHYIHIWLA